MTERVLALDISPATACQIILRVFRHRCEPLIRNLPGARDLKQARAARSRAFTANAYSRENSMNRKIVLTGLAALALAASAAPASAQGFSVGVGFGDGWYEI